MSDKERTNRKARPNKAKKTAGERRKPKNQVEKVNSPSSCSQPIGNGRTPKQTQSIETLSPPLSLACDARHEPSVRKSASISRPPGSLLNAFSGSSFSSPYSPSRHGVPSISTWQIPARTSKARSPLTSWSCFLRCWSTVQAPLASAYCGETEVERTRESRRRHTRCIRGVPRRKGIEKRQN